MHVQEHNPEPSNPLGMDGIEFIEYATSQPQALGAVLQQLGFMPVARHRSREVELYRTKADFLDRTFKRGARYLYYIVQELEKRNLPLELALLPVVESAYNPVAYSRSRASGLWQFIPSSGKHYGLEQNWWIDERRDVIESTNAALNYLLKLLRAGVWDTMLYDEVAYVVARPTSVRQDDRNRLHNPTGPAVEFGDGFDQFCSVTPSTRDLLLKNLLAPSSFQRLLLNIQ